VFKWITIFMEITGLLLLAREVYMGHQMESLQRGIEQARQMNYLYARGDYEGMWLQLRLNGGDSPEQAQKLASMLGPAAIQTAIQNQWGALAPDFAASIKRWEGKTSPAAMRRRRRWLVIGTILLVLAAAAHLF
jgi:hypothetical protein